MTREEKNGSVLWKITFFIGGVAAILSVGRIVFSDLLNHDIYNFFLGELAMLSALLCLWSANVRNSPLTLERLLFGWFSVFWAINATAWFYMMIS